MALEGWPRTPEELEALQRALAERADAAPAWTPEDPGRLLVAGVFVAFTTAQRGAGSAGDPAWAAAVLLEAGRAVATAVVRGEAGWPYAPGLLALQRGPILEGAVRALDRSPDVILVNATGRDHPLRAGLALHLGVVLDVPTVGITDRPLVAAPAEPEAERGSRAPLLVEGEVVGHVLRSRRRARPILVHAGWRTGPATAAAVALAAVGRSRTPEPLRLARRLARVRRALDEGRLVPPPRL